MCVFIFFALCPQLRLATGKTVVRRFLLSDPVAVLFAAAVSLVPEAVARPFSLQTPLASTGAGAGRLLGRSRETIEETGLANSKVMMDWD